MSKVVKFKAQGKEYPVSVKEKDGECWVSLQQIGEAIGNKQPRRLLQLLKESNEIQQDKHYRYVTEREPGDTQARTRVELSYRGTVRFAMRSQGQRAKEFRDWAEDVLYQVMMTGSYEIDMPFSEAISKAETDGMKRMLVIQEVSNSLALDMETIGRIIKFRKMGMTQAQVGAAFWLSKWQIQRIERTLKEAGVSVPAVRKKSNARKIDEIVDAFSSCVEFPLLVSGGAR